MRDLLLHQLRPASLNSIVRCFQLVRHMEKPLLAWYQYPKPDGTSFYDLSDPAIVEIIFDYCQILLAYVTKEGWQSLVKVHGIEGLLVINKRSGWFDEEDNAVATEMIYYQCHTAGYDPNKDEFRV